MSDINKYFLTNDEVLYLARYLIIKRNILIGSGIDDKDNEVAIINNILIQFLGDKYDYREIIRRDFKLKD